jgi:predicted HAD superfamily Cof-like phosphohydrolase
MTMPECWPNVPKTNFQKVKDFHEVMGLAVNEWPPSNELFELRIKLDSEEQDEYYEEMFVQNRDKQKVAKELADRLYVLYGDAVAYGIDIDNVFDAVHISNMSKLTDGVAVKRPDGKVIKGPNYKPPNLSFLGRDNIEIS